MAQDFPCLYCKGWPCTCSNTIGMCSCAPNAPPLPSCMFYSPRIWDLLAGRTTQLESTQDHWTVVDAERAAETARVAKDNRKYFDEVLVKHPEWGAFFRRFEDLKVGAKIGEGGQAEIFKATSQSFKDYYLFGDKKLVAKVWKEGVSLRDLERQWPPQMLSKVAQRVNEWPFKNIYGGAFIRDGELRNRFAFVMERRWGDLRTLIDERMLELLRNTPNHGPPFNNIKPVLSLITEVSNDLRKMHEAGVLHRDIKASNVLLSRQDSVAAFVIDYECSIGVTGTGFWRAPETLEQLQRSIPGHKVVMTKEADIYSFGMLCYEVITGCIPFESHPVSDYSIVLRGERPELPHDLHPRLKEIVLDCWEHDPQLRPTAHGLYERLRRLNNSMIRSV